MIQQTSTSLMENGELLVLMWTLNLLNSLKSSFFLNKNLLPFIFLIQSLRCLVQNKPYILKSLFEIFIKLKLWISILLEMGFIFVFVLIEYFNFCLNFLKFFKKEITSRREVINNNECLGKMDKANSSIIPRTQVRMWQREKGKLT